MSRLVALRFELGYPRIPNRAFMSEKDVEVDAVRTQTIAQVNGHIGLIIGLRWRYSRSSSSSAQCMCKQMQMAI